MNTKLPLLVILLLSPLFALSQVCTVTGTSPLNWPTDGTGIVCSEGGNAVGKSILVIPAGFTLVFDNNGDTWTGTEIQVEGTLNIAANPIINSSLIVKSGGVVNITGKLSLGSAAGCPYTLVIQSGGTVNVAGSAADRLTICNVEIMKGNGACNDCGGTNSGQCPYNGQPYCEPAGGFTGPTGFDDTGYNPALPVTLLYFNVEALEETTVSLSWATTMEENFSRFVIQRAADGLTFEDIGEVAGTGFNLHDIESKYAYQDQVPLPGFNYYRLKAVDLDESFEYFPVKVVKLLGSRRIATYPNPSSGEVISFRTNFSVSEDARIILTDQLGMEVFSARASEIGNSIVLQHKLGTGIYMLRYVSEGFEYTTRVAIRN